MSEKPQRWAVKALGAAVAPRPEHGSTTHARALAIQQANEPILAVVREAIHKWDGGNRCLICGGFWQIGEKPNHSELEEGCSMPAALAAMEEA